jgi:hypothetical protein
MENIYRKFDEYLYQVGRKNGRTIIENIELDKIEVCPGETLEAKAIEMAKMSKCDIENELQPIDLWSYLNGKAQGIEDCIMSWIFSRKKNRRRQ